MITVSRKAAQAGMLVFKFQKPSGVVDAPVCKHLILLHVLH